MKLFVQCINCKKRSVNCHDECESYQHDKKIKDAINQRKREVVSGYYYNYKTEKRHSSLEVLGNKNQA